MSSISWDICCASYYFDTDENINANAYIKGSSITNKREKKKSADKIYFYVFYVYVLC